MSKKDKKKQENEIRTAEDIVEEAAAAAAEAAEEEAEGTESEEENAAAPEEEKTDEWKEKYTRQLAEFDNFRKRTEKEKTQMFDMGAKQLFLTVCISVTASSLPISQNKLVLTRLTWNSSGRL